MQVYRGGYAPLDRRAIEAGLHRCRGLLNVGIKPLRLSGSGHRSRGARHMMKRLIILCSFF
jgi:hypothetical protein